MTEAQEKELLETVDTLRHATIRLYSLLTAKPVGELEIRGLIEKLGARTFTPLPPGIKL